MEFVSEEPELRGSYKCSLHIKATSGMHDAKARAQIRVIFWVSGKFFLNLKRVGVWRCT